MRWKVVAFERGVAVSSVSSYRLMTFLLSQLAGAPSSVGLSRSAAGRADRRAFPLPTVGGPSMTAPVVRTSEKICGVLVSRLNKYRAPLSESFSVAT